MEMRSRRELLNERVCHSGDPWQQIREELTRMYSRISTVPELFSRGGKPDDGFSLNASSLTRRLRGTLKHEEVLPMLWFLVAGCLAWPVRCLLF